MQNNPLFSILIANYNNGRFLSECIESVYKQSYEKWEVVLVDDASTDDSHYLYEKLKHDTRFKVFYNDKNKGCGYTKNKCAELAMGEICAFLDPDDILHEQALERMVELHFENKRCSLIYSNLYMCNGLKPIGDKWTEIGFVEDFLISTDKIISHFASFKRKTYLKTIGIDKKLKSSVDRDLYFKLEEVGDTLYYDEALYYYRIDNKNSLSIGTPEKVRAAYRSRVVVSLNACCRRIYRKSKLFTKNREIYLKNMRYWLYSYKQNLRRGDYFNYLKYILFYILASGCSLSALKHVIKLTTLYLKLIQKLRG